MAIRLGWIGTGLMGRPMAARLLAAGYSMTVWSRRPARASHLQSLGAALVASPAVVAANSDVLFTCLPGPDDVRQVYEGPDGLLGTAVRGSILVDMSTSDPTLTRSLSESGKSRGVDVVDAPVSGGPFGAESGSLSVMVGGPTARWTACCPCCRSWAEPLSTMAIRGRDRPPS